MEWRDGPNKSSSHGNLEGYGAQMSADFIYTGRFERARVRSTTWHFDAYSPLRLLVARLKLAAYCAVQPGTH